MAIRLVCGDGVVVTLPHEYFEKSVFNNDEIVVAHSYTLQCKARSQVVSVLLEIVEGTSENVTIPDDTVDELKSLCKELGYAGIDTQLRAFRAKTGGNSVNLEEFLLLKERVTRQDKRLTEMDRQINELLSWKRKMESEMGESVSRQFQSLERKVEEVAHVCEERNLETSRAIDQVRRECAKQSDLEELSRDVAVLKENEKQTQKREFVYDDSRKLDGIIEHLTRECGGNVHDKGIVNVTASTSSDNHPPKNSVDHGKNELFISWNSQDSWICYDFKERRVIPTSYTVRSFGGARGDEHLKSWIIEVSNCGIENSWMVLDRRDTNWLNGPYATENFKISTVPSKGFRFFRLRQTGKNHFGIHRRPQAARVNRLGDHCLVISGFEIFGTLCEK